MNDEIARFLETNELFRTFSPAERNELAARLAVTSYPSGARILTQGSPGEFLGVLMQGLVEAIRTGADGSHAVLGAIDAGGFFGEISLVTSGPHTADIVAVQDSRILAIPAAAFSRYIAANAHALSVVSETLTKRLLASGQLGDRHAEEAEGLRTAEDPYRIAATSDMEPMKVLVINCGSSSLKYQYYDTAREELRVGGVVERIGQKDSRHVYRIQGEKAREELSVTSHADAFREMERVLTLPGKGPLSSLGELSAVGHRVVHGGDRFVGSEVISDEVLAEIRHMIPLAPLHNPVNLVGIEECKKLVPEVPQVAVFDTAFHQKMLPFAYIYGVPYPLYEKYRLRRYGFHGTSHGYVAMKAATHLRRPFHHLNMITCHLGNGASVCAINHGRSVDTSMGLTPLEGLLMGTRCGDVDPGVLLFLAREEKLGSGELDSLLNKESGLRGLSGISNDMREVMEAAKKGNARALLAVQVFCYRVKKYIGAYFAALGGIDVLIFTGGIGQGSVEVRARVCQGLQHMGIVLSEDRNRNPSPSADGVCVVSDDSSRVPVLVVPTDEERMIARETIRALHFKDVKEVIQERDRVAIPVAISGMHVRLSPNDRDLLFGPDYEFRPRFKLSQPGESIAEETVDILGRKHAMRNIPIIIPLTAQSEVCVTAQDQFTLGLDAPVRLSGDLKGTPGVSLEGPLGRVTLERGVIQHHRHIHMAPSDVLRFGLKDNDLVKVRIGEDPSKALDDVAVVILPRASLELHVDGYEAETLGIGADSTAWIEGVYESKY